MHINIYINYTIPILSYPILYYTILSYTTYSWRWCSLRFQWLDSGVWLGDQAWFVVTRRFSMPLNDRRDGVSSRGAHVASVGTQMQLCGLLR